jgi:tRNA 2-selenouridine synthase
MFSQLSNGLLGEDPEKISVAKALQLMDKDSSKVVIIDTRTPNEFDLDHLPNAVNVPIFSNEERVIVGTIYKQISKSQAISRGLEFYIKNLERILRQIEPYKNKTIIVQCWRGGMRSKAVASLLVMLGYEAFQLEGGYKAYRTYVREQLENFIIKPKFVVLHGLTGTGKTELLMHLPNFIDLEGLSGHRGSAYGGVGLIKSSQKKFENELWQKLKQLNKDYDDDKLKYVFVEGESKRIGDCIIPPFVWKSMVSGVKVEITRTLDNRAQAIVKEYFDSKDKVESIRNITKTLNKNISNKRKEEVILLIENNKFVDAVKILLTDYYDPLYTHSLKELKYDHSINNDDVGMAVAELIGLF